MTRARELADLKRDLASTAANVGSHLIGYKSALNGAIARTVAMALAEEVSILDFGAVQTASPADAATNGAAFVAAIAAAQTQVTGLKIKVPAGLYYVDQLPNIADKDNMFIVGDGANTTVIYPTASVVNGFRFGSAGTKFQGISNLHIDCTLATACNAIIVQNVNSFWLNDLAVTGADIAITINAGVIQYYSGFVIRDSKTAGIKINGGSDHFFNHGLLDNDPGKAQPTKAGIWCVRSDAFWLNDIDAVRQRVGLLLEPSNLDYISWVFVQNSAFDTCIDAGVKLNPVDAGSLIVGVSLCDSWSSSNLEGVRFTGAGTTDGTLLSSMRCFNNKRSGISVDEATIGTHKNFDVVDSYVSGNSTETPNNWSGIDIGPGVSQWTISNTRSKPMANFAATQNRGILINPGTSDHYSITGGDVRGNVEGIFDGGTGTDKVISAVLGAKTASRGASAIAIGTSSKTVTHGLDFTPAASDVIISPLVNMGSVGVTDLWVSAANATTFTVSANANTTGLLDFSWDARVKGA